MLSAKVPQTKSSRLTRKNRFYTCWKSYFVSRYGQRPEPTRDEGKLWNQIIEKMIKVTRLRHLSLNTELTYTGWSRRLQAYVNGKGPNGLATDGIRTIQQFLGHADGRTTTIYTHITSKNFLGVRSPLDQKSEALYRVLLKCESTTKCGYQYF